MLNILHTNHICIYSIYIYTSSIFVCFSMLFVGTILKPNKSLANRTYVMANCGGLTKYALCYLL